MGERPVVEIDGLPETVEAFAALQAEVARTPEGAAAMMVVALWLLAEDDKVGRQALAAAVDRSRLQAGSGGSDGWRLGNRDLQLIRSQVGGRGYRLRSYVAGATPQNGYALPEPPYRIACSSNPYSGDPDSGQFKLFVASSGADSSRPVTLRRGEDGLWRAMEWSSLLLGVREPAVPQAHGEE
jgi:hypothetical protein